MDDDYISTNEAAALFDEPLRDIYARIDAGELAAWRMPGATHLVIRVKRADVMALAVEARRGGSASNLGPMGEEQGDQSFEGAFDEAFAANRDLVKRLAGGDIHALASLIESTAGVQVVQTRTIASAP